MISADEYRLLQNTVTKFHQSLSPFTFSKSNKLVIFKLTSPYVAVKGSKF